MRGEVGYVYGGVCCVYRAMWVRLCEGGQQRGAGIVRMYRGLEGIVGAGLVQSEPRFQMSVTNLQMNKLFQVLFRLLGTTGMQ